MKDKTKQVFRKYGRYVFIGVLLFSNFFIWYAVFAEDREGQLTIAFLDVGQGDGIFIDSPMGNQILIDGGGSDGKVLRSLD